MEQTNPPALSQTVSVTFENDDVCTIMAVSDAGIHENCLTGYVSDKSSGKPIEDACIKLTDNALNSISQGYTDSKGHFSVPAGSATSCRILVAKKGYCTYTSELLNLACIGKKGVDIALMPAESEGIVLFGCVRDYLRKPAQGVRVTLSRTDKSRREESTMTNAEGYFLFDGLEQGTYRITCESPAHETYSRVFQPVPENPVYILETIYLKRKELKGTVFGVITDSHDMPVPNAVVVLFSGDNVPLQVTRTNEKGVYMFYNLEMGTYKIMAK
ncbi:MAG TPA: carboxypeptidase-like regulatory domain-containing protein [Thermoclostridium caenicola]|uniref:Carboxypeptidase regulatory-like domain-containing protein n=1 Tax=Thermoclostridium caenicola TaxID=659425 RepID=A0A1M6J8L2_9FIRM|nr:carboxypeptidase-like regulatory domain-containing protein [Thermoclostridium caenicola]SHJ43021.1 Carboxypeptidase regulatory-like domain-containing protein [Thermoclostridium caenicola]HOK44148.1 carboxypeptidase-like regulatory domain-containing protein [Thermoclostridium caenicola]HOL85079.1 carboxypeptidase-like regulatory domain-containing protein [Thermoclostridium caenicola]HPO77206.1 carboxypeptidase-like regulatory domain-containing protein [Thermoclostridium caenicola]